MKDLKSYKEIFCSSELELYFMEENGSCSFVKRKYDYIYRDEEAIVATNALMPLVDYPSSDDSLIQFSCRLGIYTFTIMCDNICYIKCIKRPINVDSVTTADGRLLHDFAFLNPGIG